MWNSIFTIKNIVCKFEKNLSKKVVSGLAGLRIWPSFILVSDIFLENNPLCLFSHVKCIRKFESMTHIWVTWGTEVLSFSTNSESVAIPTTSVGKFFPAATENGIATLFVPFHSQTSQCNFWSCIQNPHNQVIKVVDLVL